MSMIHPNLLTRSAQAIALAIVCMLIMTSCANNPSKGYAFDSNFDSSINSISIPIFANNTLERGLEVQLTESINKQIRARTPWNIVNSDTADTTLVGVITGHNLQMLSQGPRTGLVQEQTVRITVSFEWRDNRTGDLLVARNNYAATSTFAPERRIGERIEQGQRQAIEELAVDLVSQLRQSW